MTDTYISTFTHENQAVRNWIEFINSNDKMTAFEKAQYFVMTGISMNDCKLIEYGISLDKSAVNTPVSNNVLQIIDAIMSPVTGCHLSSNKSDEVCEATVSSVASPPPLSSPPDADVPFPN